jgi:hypothetical protein
LQPVGGHAVFAMLDPKFLGDSSKSAIRAFQARLYELAGVRAWPAHQAQLQKTVLRLALPIARFTVEELGRAAVALRSAFTRLEHEAIPKLKEAGPSVHEVWARYVLADG